MNLTETEIYKARDFSFYCSNSEENFIRKIIDRGEKTSNINGFDLRKKFDYYLKPLSSAVSSGNYGIVKFLLKLGANPNVYDQGNFTNINTKKIYPLWIALRNDDTKIIKILIKFGANPYIGNRIIKLIHEKGYIEVVKDFFPKMDTKMHIKGLKNAAINNRADILDLYFDYFGKNNEEFKENIDIFFKGFEYACLSGDYEIISIYIRHIDDKKINYPEGFFENGFMQLLCVETHFNTAMIIFMKCNSNYIDDYGSNFIVSSIENIQFEILIFLIDYCNLNLFEKSNEYFDYLCKNIKSFLNCEEEDENIIHSKEFEKTFIKIMNHCKGNINKEKCLKHLRRNLKELEKFINIIEENVE